MEISRSWVTKIFGLLIVSWNCHGLPLWLSWQRICLQYRRPGFNPWVGKIPWRRKRLPIAVFWPGEFHGLYSPWGDKELDTTDWLSLTGTVKVLLDVSYTLLIEDQDKLTCLPSWTHLILISLCCVTGLYDYFKSWALLNVLLLLSDSLWPHGLQHARLPCPSQSPRACSSSCSLSQWCHPSISSCFLFVSFLQSFPASGSFSMSWFFTSSGQSTRASVSAPVFLMNIQGWFPLGLIGLIFLKSKRLSRVFSNTLVQKHQFFRAQPSSCLLEKNTA